MQNKNYYINYYYVLVQIRSVLIEIKICTLTVMINGDNGNILPNCFCDSAIFKRITESTGLLFYVKYNLISIAPKHGTE